MSSAKGRLLGTFGIILKQFDVYGLFQKKKWYNKIQVY